MSYVLIFALQFGAMRETILHDFSSLTMCQAAGQHLTETHQALDSRGSSAPPREARVEWKCVGK